MARILIVAGSFLVTYGFLYGCNWLGARVNDIWIDHRVRKR